MLKQERHKVILEQLEGSQKVNFGQLEKLLGVSYDSIRRDVIELEDKGLLTKVHGGIVANSYIAALNEKNDKFLGSKELEVVVEKSIPFIQAHQMILMDGGITNFHIASQIPKDLECTVITNSPPLVVALNDHPMVSVIMLGGTYFKKYQITKGAEVMRQLESFRPSLYFMGVNGIHPEKGLTVRNYEESLLKRKMAEISDSVISCSIDEKLDHAESYKVLEAKDLDYLVTNLKPNSTRLKALAEIPIRIY